MMDVELPAYVTLDEVVAAAGLDKEVLRRHLARKGAMRRFSRAPHVDTDVLSVVEPTMHARVIMRRIQKSMLV